MTHVAKITTLLERVRRGGAYTCAALEAMNEIAAEAEALQEKLELTELMAKEAGILVEARAWNSALCVAADKAKREGFLSVEQINELKRECA